MFDLDTIGRLELAALPTPIQFCRTLTEHLGGPRIFVKRDDLTGASGGGNKVRKPHRRLAGPVRLPLRGGEEPAVTGRVPPYPSGCAAAVLSPQSPPTPAAAPLRYFPPRGGTIREERPRLLDDDVEHPVSSYSGVVDRPFTL